MAAPPLVAVALERIAEVDGWLTEDQARTLFAAASDVRPGGRIVEIGSFRGRSTIVLATAAADGVEVVAIDPHAGNDRGPQEIAGFEAEAAGDHERFRSNLSAAGVAGRVRHVRAFSAEAHAAVDGAVDLLWVDGAHRYRPARDDLHHWGDRVVPGGRMLVHDSWSSVGVTLAIVRRLAFDRRWRYDGRVGSLARYTKVRSGPGSTLRQLAELPWFALNVVKKLLTVLRLRKGAWPY
jgi:predicted O-methyltransferase YrrM